MLKRYLNKKILLSLLFYSIISIFLYFSNVAVVNASVIRSYESSHLKYVYGTDSYMILEGFQPPTLSRLYDRTHIRYKTTFNLTDTDYSSYNPFYNYIKKYDYKFYLNQLDSPFYLNSIEFFQRIQIEDPYISNQDTCVTRFEDLFANLYVHQLWSFYIDYDYDNEKFEPIEWLATMVSYNAYFNDYTTTEKIIQKDDVTYREIVFSVTVQPYYYTYDSTGEIVINPNDFKDYVSYGVNYSTCNGSLHYQFDFFNLLKAHQVNIGPVPANSGSYL